MSTSARKVQLNVSSLELKLAKVALNISSLELNISSLALKSNFELKVLISVRNDAVVAKNRSVLLPIMTVTFSEIDSNAAVLFSTTLMNAVTLEPVGLGGESLVVRVKQIHDIDHSFQYSKRNAE